MNYFLHSLKTADNLGELENYFDSRGFVRMPADYVYSIINNPLLKIYHRFFFRKPYRSVENHNLAESIFNICQVEYLKDPDNVQAKKIAYKAAMFCVDSLDEKGKYTHDEHDNEDQFALHEAAICTLINAYNLFGNKVFLESAIRATDYLLNSRFEKKIGRKIAYWFPHDTLELESGKNEFVLNTHLYTIAVLCMMYDYTKNDSYLDGAKRGVLWFNHIVKDLDENNYPFFDGYLIGKCSIGFLPLPGALFDFIRMSKKPGFQTNSGFLKRAVSQPGPHYHFCNWLYLEMVHQYIPLDETVLENAVEYGVYLIKNGFNNKLYIHSDWYFNAALMMAVRRNPSLKKYAKYVREDIGLDPRQFQTLEPTTPKKIQKPIPTNFIVSVSR